MVLFLKIPTFFYFLEIFLNLEFDVIGTLPRVAPLF